MPIRRVEVPVREPGTVAENPASVRHWTLPASRAAVRRVRAELRDQCELWGMAGADVEDVVLVADELLSNAVIHGQGPVMVTLRAAPHHVYVGVIDRDPSARPARAAAGAHEEAGRGLTVVSTLASAWGSERQTHGSKLVWATVRRRESR